MQSFNVEISSNASLDTYTENTLSSFCTVLGERLSLEGQWCVSLADVTYPKNTYPKNTGTFDFNYQNKGIKTDKFLLKLYNI